MADWQFTLDFHNFWHTLSVQDTTTEVIIRLNELLIDIHNHLGGSIYNDMADELENNIIPLFEELQEDEDDNVEHFDDALEQLYDWADASLDNQWGGKKMCWIKTI